ncbi:hypothetical protein [Clostridium celatum]|uniref:hypothetical protein n=1 Tax=Clostridium celatum TaxID=36834 RepID=UPI002900A924|nr:hypothetical protein [Clostridium celatum]MDU2266698.1 hypothetical protein [Clostridium celatum]MDU6297058.1 hypothetical protein [Clostridium celatum]
MFYIKVYTKDHIILDEIHEIADINYMHTLNGVGKMTFSIPLLCSKFTSTNFTQFNHIELYEDDIIKWFGVITNVNFNNPSVQVACLGYLHLIEKIRLNEDEYYNKRYGDLVMQLLNSVRYKTSIKEGKVIQDDIKTDRIIKNNDMLYDKISALCEEMNYYFDIDKDLNLNFYNKKGTDKSYLVLQQTEEYSNILKTPTISTSSDNLVNCVYAETTFTEEVYSNVPYYNYRYFTEGTVVVAENVEVTLKSEKRNNESIEKYGLNEGVLSVNDIRLQETLDKYLEAELEKYAFPALNIMIEAIDSALCPFNLVEVGDWITVHLEPYFDLRQKVRLIEIERNCTTDTYKVTVGNVLYRENKVKTKVYTA